jgi:hypothetical protein
VVVTRFDDLVRSERYFTATLLPAILLSGEFSGLNSFLALVDERSLTPPGRPTERSKTGAVAIRSAKLPSWSPEKVEVISEFHIARDLAFAGHLVSNKLEADAENSTEKERRDAPDLVVVLDDELVVCEAKFFDTVERRALNRQLQSQRLQVRYLFEVRPSLRAYRHVAILPLMPQEAPDCDVVLTWGDIADLSAKILGPEHYVTRRLSSASNYFQSLNSGLGLRNYDELLPLNAVLDLCAIEGDTIFVGHSGGEPDLMSRPIQYLEEKAWKLRDPSVNAGKVMPRNWIRRRRFQELIELRRSQAQVAVG